MNAKMLVRSLLVVLSMAAYPAASYAGFWSVGISVAIPPPPIPVYVQPPCPSPGYIWTPGYWAYADDDQDYYWVPGTWVYAPAPGLLWTPGYWGYENSAYLWHAGYWGPHVGFYGGINYGFGYFGVGFGGGYWRSGGFFYNRAVANVGNVSFTHVYNNTTVVNNFGAGHPSFNGPDGVHARPGGAELAAEREPHRGWSGEQRLHAEDAHAVPALLASHNHGEPPIAATPRAAQFRGNDPGAARAAGSGATNWRAAGMGRPHAPGAFTAPEATRSGPGTVPRDRSLEPAPRAAPARSDRPAWALSGARTQPAVADARRAEPAARAATSWQPRPAYGGTGAAWTRAARAQAPERAWQQPTAPPRHAYAAPAPAPHWSEPRSMGASPRAAVPRPQAPARGAPAEAGRSRRPA
jgi:hypothetical protein